MGGQLENALYFAVGVLLGLRAEETRGCDRKVHSGWVWGDMGTDGLAVLEVQVADRQALNLWAL